MACRKKLVSVIIACFNAEKYIDACLASILNQTYNNFEIVICDDCSTDNSYRKLLEWGAKESRIIVLKNQSNSYAAATRNHCFDNARGEFFMIQDIDDLCEPNRIDSLVDALESNQIDFVCSGVKFFENDPHVIKRVINNKKDIPQKIDFLWDVPFFHPATMFKSCCIKDVGGYRVAEETRRMEDFDLFMRLYANGYRGMNIPEPLYLYRYDLEQQKRSLGFQSVIEEISVRWGGVQKPWDSLVRLAISA